MGYMQASNTTRTYDGYRYKRLLSTRKSIKWQAGSFNES